MRQFCRFCSRSIMPCMDHLLAVNRRSRWCSISHHPRVVCRARARMKKEGHRRRPPHKARKKPSRSSNNRISNNPHRHQPSPRQKRRRPRPYRRNHLPNFPRQRPVRLLSPPAMRRASGASRRRHIVIGPIAPSGRATTIRCLTRWTIPSESNLRLIVIVVGVRQGQAARSTCLSGRSA